MSLLLSGQKNPEKLLIKLVENLLWLKSPVEASAIFSLPAFIERLCKTAKINQNSLTLRKKKKKAPTNSWHLVKIREEIFKKLFGKYCQDEWKGAYFWCERYKCNQCVLNMHWNWYFFTDFAKLLGFYGRKASKCEFIQTTT